MKIKTFFFALLIFLPFVQLSAQTDDPLKSTQKLFVLWTSGDPDVAERVALMYTHAAKKNAWFDEVTLIIWGPSAKLSIENQTVQKMLLQMQKDGVKLEACIVCANSYGVTDDLKKLGITVKGMGKPLTDYLKSGETVLTF